MDNTRRLLDQEQVEMVVSEKSSSDLSIHGNIIPSIGQTSVQFQSATVPSKKQKNPIEPYQMRIRQDPQHACEPKKYISHNYPRIITQGINFFVDVRYSFLYDMRNT